mmetsp:Transcript_103947/g.310438  ORF Transcript_103947/g.310438 Transcript_103947/m.310438 type:complete len:215 (+) Transcript_103947:220-864(+)
MLRKRSEPKSMECQTACDSLVTLDRAGSLHGSSESAKVVASSAFVASSAVQPGPCCTQGLASADVVVARDRGSLFNNSSRSRTGASEMEPQARPEKVSGFSRTARAGSSRPFRPRREKGSCRLNKAKAMSPAPNTSEGGPARPPQLSGAMYIPVPARFTFWSWKAVLSVTGSGRTHARPKSKSLRVGKGWPGTTGDAKPKFSGLMSRCRAPSMR